jgi:hypothetical protein
MLCICKIKELHFFSCQYVLKVNIILESSVYSITAQPHFI